MKVLFVGVRLNLISVKFQIFNISLYIVYTIVNMSKD